MKKSVVVLCLLCLALTGWAQQVDVQDIDPAQVDLNKVDLSGIEFFFNGPLQLYVSGLGYGDQTYDAVLDYSGGGTVAVSAPLVVGTEGKPREIDLSQASVQVDQSGIRLRDVIVDGYNYSGRLAVTKDNRLAVQSITRGQRVSLTAGRAAELESEIGRLEVSLQQKDDRIARLNRQLEQRPEAEQVRELRAQIQELETQAERQNERIAELQNVAAGLRTEDWMTASQRLRTLLLSGFGKGSVVSGTWNVSGGAAAQTGAQQLYAKYAMPVRQDAGELLFSFTGSAQGSGKRGYGLHFLASGSTANGYGYGNSYLVWVTRDPSHYQNDMTYVQLYRSYDDVRMVELASAAVPPTITSRSDLQVYVKRDEQTISVALDGRQVLRFRDPNMIRSGSQVAARAMGAVRLENLVASTD
jgi:TolA-binding protein